METTLDTLTYSFTSTAFNSLLEKCREIGWPKEYVNDLRYDQNSLESIVTETGYDAPTFLVSIRELGTNAYLPAIGLAEYANSLEQSARHFVWNETTLTEVSIDQARQWFIDNDKLCQDELPWHNVSMSIPSLDQLICSVPFAVRSQCRQEISDCYTLFLRIFSNRASIAGNVSLRLFQKSGEQYIADWGISTPQGERLYNGGIVIHPPYNSTGRYHCSMHT